MFEVVALGELLIDFTPAGCSSSGENLFEENPGGAPANVVTALARLGRRTGFIGKVGNDQFGYYLRSVLEKHNVCTNGPALDSEANTTLAFVHLAENGERSFSFYRNPGADTRLTIDEIKPEMLDTRIFHFGSLSLTDEPTRSTTLAVLRKMKEQNVLVSYDPNFRPPLWSSLSQARKLMLQAMHYADIVKLTDDELLFVLGTNDLARGSAELAIEFDLSAVLVTLGERGCFYYVQGQTGVVPAFSVEAVDTTGSGDAFVAGILHKVLEHDFPITQWNRVEMEESVLFANAVGGLASTKKGGIPAMPSLDEVNQLLQTGRLRFSDEV